MADVQITGNVLDEQGNTIGSISGTYIDDSQDGTSEQLVQRTIDITVVDENGNNVGSGSLNYQDYITYNGGGTRTINLTGNVIDDSNNSVGNISGELNDTYGAITTTVTTTSMSTKSNWWIWLVLGAVGLLLIGRRKEE